MKKRKNILLLIGICFYVLSMLLEILIKITKDLSPYQINVILLYVLVTLLHIALPTILLILNLKNKFNKVFTIIVATLSALLSVYLLIDPYLRAIPEYLILSKLGLIDTIWVYILPRSGILSLISSLMITVGSVLSIEKKNNNY